MVNLLQYLHDTIWHMLYWCIYCIKILFQYPAHPFQTEEVYTAYIDSLDTETFTYLCSITIERVYCVNGYCIG